MRLPHGQRLLTLLAAPSLVLAIAITALWLRSYWRTDAFTWMRKGWTPTTSTIEGIIWQSSRGGLGYSHSLQATTVTLGRIVTPKTQPVPQWQYSSNQAKNYPGSPASRIRFLGLRWDKSSIPAPLQTNGRIVGSTVKNYTSLVIPHAFPLALTLILPTYWCLCRRSALRRFRQSQNLCPTCGYDLRATPNRCPECGTLAAGVTDPVSKAKPA